MDPAEESAATAAAFMTAAEAATAGNCPTTAAKK
jgi:hypothetical protein